jgi:hypothetical protein
VKNPEMDDKLSESIMSRYAHVPSVRIGPEKTGITEISGKIMELSERIQERHEIQFSKQPEKIADALMQCKEQMLVRDSHKPEYFLKEFGLTQDDETFGFVNQAGKNRLTKFAIDLIFTKGSSLFYDYFKTRVSVVSTEISGLSRKRIDADR